MYKSVFSNDGKSVEQIVLSEGQQQLTLLNLGCCTQDWRVQTRNGTVPVVLGYQDPLAYFQNHNWLGAIAGPVANRIGGNGFSLDGTRYPLNADADGITLHSGDADLSKRMFTVEMDQSRNAVRFEYTSAHGEGGFPANVRFVIEVMLRNGVVTYDMRALPDRATPIALAQHNYYNLMGENQIWDHHLQLNSDEYTPLKSNGLPEGSIAPVSPRMDFREGVRIKDNDPTRLGYDDNFVLKPSRDLDSPVARLKANNGLQLEMWSDQPALQFYTGTHLKAKAQDDVTFGPFSGLCLEPQIHPNAVNMLEFPSPIVTPENPYHQRLTLKLADRSTTMALKGEG